jgi:hypothetical protein
MRRVRVILWTVAMAYTGFVLTGQGLRTFNSRSITEAFLGAVTGCLLAIMFTLRSAFGLLTDQAKFQCCHGVAIESVSHIR